MAESELDAANAAFWEELCDTDFARSVGLTDPGSHAQVDRYDEAYLALYPYLARYLQQLYPDGMRVLEVGPGYGTVGRELLRRGADYHAVDVASAAVEVARESLRRFGRPEQQAAQASVLELPWEDESFDRAVAIGSLHHAGDLPRAVAEVRRVLRPGGIVLAMLYNARSPNRLVTVPAARLAARLLPGRRDWILSRTLRDRNLAGAPAPHTDFVTRAQARALFGAFTDARVEAQGAAAVTLFRRTLVSRELLLPTLGRLGGLDLYVLARR